MLCVAVATRVPTIRRQTAAPRRFVSLALPLGWLMNQGIGTAHIAPGKPSQNGTDESFNGEFRDECLHMEWYGTNHLRQRRRSQL